MPPDVRRTPSVVVVQYDALLKAAKAPSDDSDLADLEHKIEQVLAPDLSLCDVLLKLAVQQTDGAGIWTRRPRYPDSFRGAKLCTAPTTPTAAVTNLCGKHSQPSVQKHAKLF